MTDRERKINKFYFNFKKIKSISGVCRHLLRDSRPKGTEEEK
jgi:hypothetical protein